MGLGVLMTRARKSFDVATLFSCVVVVVIVTIISVEIVKIIENFAIKWRNYE